MHIMFILSRPAYTGGDREGALFLRNRQKLFTLRLAGNVNSEL